MNPTPNSGQGGASFFALTTGKDQYVVKADSSDELHLSGERGDALLFQMRGAPGNSDGLVLLQTLGGRMQVPADPSQGVALRDGSAGQVPFLKVPVSGGFALGTPDRAHWLSVSDEGKLVLSELRVRAHSDAAASRHPAGRQKLYIFQRGTGVRGETYRMGFRGRAGQRSKGGWIARP